MKSKLIILGVVVLMFSASQVFAEGGHDHGKMAGEKGSMMEHSEAVPEGGSASVLIFRNFISMPDVISQKPYCDIPTT